MPASYVKPYVKRNKNDGRDAEGVCEAMGRPTMRFVAVKSVEQQAVLVIHSTPTILDTSAHDDRQCAACGAERVRDCGAAPGLKGLRTLIEQLRNPSDEVIPEVRRATLFLMAWQWEALDADIQCAGPPDRTCRAGR